MFLKVNLSLLLIAFGLQASNLHNPPARVNLTSMDIPIPVKNLHTTKEERRKELYQLLGKLPDRQRPISVKLISREETEEYILEKLLLDINGLELVPAYFTKPKNAKGKVPVVLFNHSHFG